MPRRATADCSKPPHLSISNTLATRIPMEFNACNSNMWSKLWASSLSRIANNVSVGLFFCLSLFFPVTWVIFYTEITMQDLCKAFHREQRFYSTGRQFSPLFHTIHFISVVMPELYFIKCNILIVELN